MTTALVQWHYASVADHGLAVRYTARAFDSRAVARELQVRYLVAAELGRQGDRFRLEARVIDGPRANQVWSGTLEVQGSDAGEAERILVVRLSRRVRAAVDKAEKDRSRLAAPPLTARQLTWRGDDAWSQAPNELDGIAAARKFYQQALALDSNFIDAIISEWWALNGEFEGKIDADRGRLVQEMDTLSVRALGIDGNDPAAWDIRTSTLGWLGRWDEALAANSRSQELDPSSLEYSTRRGWLLLSLGRAADVLTLEERLIALDPPGSTHMHRHICQAQLLLGNYAAAIDACQRTGALERWWLDQMILVAAYAQLGNTEKAAVAKAALLSNQPRFTISGYMAKHRSDEPEYLRQMNTHVLPGLRKAGVPE
jgi:tetratricopeptide (TPR) repeat protein